MTDTQLLPTRNAEPAGMIAYECDDCGRTERRYASNGYKVCSSCRGRLRLKSDPKPEKPKKPPRKLHPLTAGQMILLSAHHLEEIEAPQWTLAYLAIIAWRKWPVRFGLPGFAETHPDSNKVYCVVMDRKPLGLQGRGLIHKISPGVYALTELGREEARKLAANGG